MLLYLQTQIPTNPPKGLFTHYLLILMFHPLLAAVSLDGKALSMLPAQTEQEVILGMAQGELSLLWQLHRADYGQAVEITTGEQPHACLDTYSSHF